MKKLIYILIVLALIGVGVWYWQTRLSKTSDQGSANQQNETASMNQDLDGIKIEEANFNQIDADLNTL